MYRVLLNLEYFVFFIMLYSGPYKKKKKKHVDWGWLSLGENEIGGIYLTSCKEAPIVLSATRSQLRGPSAKRGGGLALAPQPYCKPFFPGGTANEYPCSGPHKPQSGT